MSLGVLRSRATLSVFLVLACLVLGAVLLPAATAQGPTPTATRPAGTRIYLNERQNYQFRYPEGWLVNPDSQTGRYPSLKGLLLSNFPLSTETVGRGLLLPPGGAAAIVRFEGPARATDLLEEARTWLSSIDYVPSGRFPIFGSHRTIELMGETGRLYFLALNRDLYSVFVPAEDDPAAEPALAAVIASLTPLTTVPVLLPRGETALPGLVGPVRVPPRGPAAPPALPTMRMPWSSQEQYTYTGGPHNGSSLNSCDKVPLLGASGLDWGLSYDDLLAVADGTLQAKGFASGGIGNYVIVDHGNGWSTRYWHLEQIDAHVIDAANGTAIPRGRLLGTSGTAGTGPHLHLELRYNDSSSGVTWHGANLDGYVVRGILDATNMAQTLNYQGTLTRGTESSSTLNYVYCANAPAIYWRGSSGTIEAGSSTGVVSTNVKSYWPCAPGPDEVAFYLDIDYANQCTVRGIGEYADSAAIGLPDNSLSSVRVGANVQVLLCRDTDLSGVCELARADDSDLRNNSVGNDTVSSARVQRRYLPVFVPLLIRP